MYLVPRSTRHHGSFDRLVTAHQYTLCKYSFRCGFPSTANEALTSLFKEPDMLVGWARAKLPRFRVKQILCIELNILEHFQIPLNPRIFLDCGNQQKLSCDQLICKYIFSLMLIQREQNRYLNACSTINLIKLGTTLKTLSLNITAQQWLFLCCGEISLW